MQLRYIWKRLFCGLLALISSIAAATPMLAQTGLPRQEGFPILNATGRYLGYGWSRRGYQAQGNGQLRIVRSNHPASQYSSRSLAYPYSPHYRPQQARDIAAPTAQPAPTHLHPSPTPAPQSIWPQNPSEFPPRDQSFTPDTAPQPKKPQPVEEVPAEDSLLESQELLPRRTFLKPPAPLPESSPTPLEDSSPSDLLAPIPPENPQLKNASPLEAPPTGSAAEPALQSSDLESSSQDQLDKRIEQRLGPVDDADDLLLDEADSLDLEDDEAENLLQFDQVSFRSRAAGQPPQVGDSSRLQWIGHTASTAGYRQSHSPRENTLRRGVRNRVILLRP